MSLVPSDASFQTVALLVAQKPYLSSQPLWSYMVLKLQNRVRPVLNGVQKCFTGAKAYLATTGSRNAADLIFCQNPRCHHTCIPENYAQSPHPVQSGMDTL